MKKSELNCEISEEFQQVFSELTEELSERQKCKKSEIPNLLGISYTIYTNILNFGKIPRPLVLMRIADVFGISVEYLLGRTHDDVFEPSEKPTGFLTRYRELKEMQQITDYVISKHLHVSTSYPANWKKKGFLPSLKNLIILSDLFEVSLDYLLGRTDDSSRFLPIESWPTDPF